MVAFLLFPSYIPVLHRRSRRLFILGGYMCGSGTTVETVQIIDLDRLQTQAQHDSQKNLPYSEL